MLHKLLVILMLAKFSNSQTECGLMPPQSSVAPMGSNATFQCIAANGLIIWSVNNIQVSSPSLQQFFATHGIFIPLERRNNSTVMILATPMNNGTRLTCLVGEFAVVCRSDPVTLIVYGEPSPLSELIIRSEPENMGIFLMWSPGVSILGEKVEFIVSSNNLVTGLMEESRVNTTSLSVRPPMDHEGKTYQEYNFTVYSENGFSRSSSGVSGIAIIPKAPLDLDSITSFTSLLQGPSVTISFHTPSPCPEFEVDKYVLSFAEEANSEDVLPFTAFNASYGAVTLNDTGGDNI